MPEQEQVELRQASLDVPGPDEALLRVRHEHHRDTYIKAEPGESPNDRNDRATRSPPSLPASHTQQAHVLLTNDRGNLLRAKEEGVAASVRQFAREHAADAPELMDLVAGNDIDDEDVAAAAADDAPSAKRVKTARGRPRRRRRRRQGRQDIRRAPLGVADGGRDQGGTCTRDRCARVGSRRGEGYVGPMRWAGT